MFREMGFAATSVEAITADVGVTRGALYKHFDGKEGLFLALASESGTAQLMHWARGESTAVSDDDHLEALIALVADVDLGLALAALEFIVFARTRPDLLAQTAELQEQADEKALTLLRQTCESLGVTPALPLEDLLPLIVAIANGLHLRKALDPALDTTRLFRLGVAALLNPSVPTVAAVAPAARTKPTRSAR